MNQPYPKKVTYAEYSTWGDEPQYEIINGIPFLQAAPSRQHQRIVTQLTGELYTFFKGKKCEVYTAPFDVRLSGKEDEKEYQVVQPDISVVCDEKKLDDKGCKGAPDLIAEILSPSTWQKDRIEKLNQYQRHGVKEYLLIYPNEKILEQYILGESDLYGTPTIYTEEDIFCSHISPELELPIKVFLS
ncbi:Uma2 family endonuclease [Aquibacillus sediminis]|uniref:Uma2 family endonuclease n=1 Tax=Aquibacillus sediminis TaxID=2574734 RepID=UPI001108DB59|nr:Uma2 family endonuclease [Aquibacillus sediminis]